MRRKKGREKQKRLIQHTPSQHYKAINKSDKLPVKLIKKGKQERKGKLIKSIKNKMDTTAHLQTLEDQGYSNDFMPAHRKTSRDLRFLSKTVLPKLAQGETEKLQLCLYSDLN